MHRTFLIFAGLVAFGASLRAAEAVLHEVKVGSQTLVIPTPEGFERMDGIDAKQDQVANEIVAGGGNRYVIVFGLPQAAAAMRRGEVAESPRTLHALTMRSMEHRALRPVDFETFRATAESDLDRLGKNLGGVMSKAGADASKSLSQNMKDAVEVKFGEPVSLGVFERTRDSLGFSIMFRKSVKNEGKSDAGMKVVSTLIVRVRDRVLLLYATADRNSEADDAWVKSEVLEWRDAIFVANGQTDAPASSTASRLLQQFNFKSILVMAALGAAAGLIVFFVRRHQKPPTPPPAAS
jgi:hypothetical protein